jgi:hypothetical protein
MLRIPFPRIAIAAAVLAGAVTSPIAAEREVASIARVTGNAMVNKGAQYVTGTEGMALSIGDRVMSLDETTAVIQFEDGCRYTMEENEMITIPSRSPCVLTKGSAKRLAVGPPVPPPAAVPVAPAVVPAATSSLWVPGAVGLAAIAGVAILWRGDDGNAPPLPPISQ